MTVWIDRDRAFVARRYDHLARLITLFEWLLFVPGKFREKAVATLELKPGDRVLEIGCGTGRNLPALRAAVGDAGHVYGIDLSAGMLTRARSLVDSHQWRNVTLVHGDAVDSRRPSHSMACCSASPTAQCRIITRSFYRHWRSCGQAAASA